MKKLILMILALMVAFGGVYAGAEEPGAENTEDAVWFKAYICGPLLRIGSGEAAVRIMTNDPAWAVQESDGFAENQIRYYPADPDTGLFAAGESIPAGERAELLTLSDDRMMYTVKLKEPGRYVLSGETYYVLDSASALHADIRAELIQAVEKSIGDTETITAQKLHNWLCDRVKSVFPKDAEESFIASCADPMNALMNGYASREAYAELYHILLDLAGIRDVRIRGEAGGESGEWNMCRLDGVWVWTDPAMDDRNDSTQRRYLSKPPEEIARDHVAGPEDSAFIHAMIEPAVADLLYEGTLPFDFAETGPGSSRAFEFFWYDGPAFVVGDSATVTYHRASNVPFDSGAWTTAEYIEHNMIYKPWMPEQHYYYDEFLFYDDPALAPEIPPTSELFTVDEAADDMSTFTITYHAPGIYALHNDESFWLISPEQTEPAELAAKLQEKIEKVLSESKTEKAAAQKLFQYVTEKLAYNYRDESARALGSEYEPFSALLYGKAVCGGYALTYHILAKNAGIHTVVISGSAKGQGHTWCLNRLDGVWSYSDPTWGDGNSGYFAVQPERLKTHINDSWSTKTLFFSDPFTVLADQVDAQYKQKVYVPESLSVLPGNIDQYGFPAQTPAFVLITDYSGDASRVEIKLNRSVYKSRISLMSNMTQEVNMESYGGQQNANQIHAPVNASRLVRVILASYEFSYEAPKRESIYEEIFYQQKEQISADYRWIVPMKKGEVFGCQEGSYRIYGYDAELKPAYVRWHLVTAAAETDLTVRFGEDGAASGYEVSYKEYSAYQAVTWTGTPDGRILTLNGRELDESEQVHPGIESAVSFRQ